MPKGRKLRRLAALTGLLVFCAPAGCAQSGTAEAAGVVASPNRPSASDSAAVLSRGLLQGEYGWSQSRPGDASRESGFDSMMRLGLGRGLELRWGWDAFLVRTEGGVAQRGAGDIALGLQYQIRPQSPRLPVLALGYAIKLPSASRGKGLGTGRVDHALAFLASREIRGTTLDFNAVYNLSGREGATGCDHHATLILAASRPIRGPVTLIGEIIGATRRNPGEPAAAATLWALAWQVRPRWALDGGVEAGLTPGTTHRRVFAGLSWAFGNLPFGRTRRTRRGGFTPPGVGDARKSGAG